MPNRRRFIQGSFWGLGALISAPAFASNLRLRPGGGQKPIVISTWDHGKIANAKAWEILSNKGTALDAVEAGVMVVESDPKTRTVGIGGYPDREGRVTLDACIMDHNHNCGAVAFLQDIKNPIAVARKVMEETPHVFLAGAGAKQFALEQGFKEENLLTEQARKDYEDWLEKSKYSPVINIENHDTIGMLALDAAGNLSGSCTTSGASYKMHGRVGDSPIIGAGLFVDNEIGAACATGLGEAVIRVAGSHLVVELMRQGRTPEEACKEAVERLIAKNQKMDGVQVGFLALNKDGVTGAYSVYNGFTHAVRSDQGESLEESGHKREWE